LFYHHQRLTIFDIDIEIFIRFQRLYNVIHVKVHPPSALKSYIDDTYDTDDIDNTDDIVKQIRRINKKIIYQLYHLLFLKQIYNNDYIKTIITMIIIEASIVIIGIIL
jgi:hypothetical protein